MHLVYVSPLKSLADDIRENLRRPLEGIVLERRLEPDSEHNLSDVLAPGLGMVPASASKNSGTDSNATVPD